MPIYTMLKISWGQLEWSDFHELLQPSDQWSVIDVRRCGPNICTSVDALRSASSREAWLNAARRVEFPLSLVALAE